MNKSSRHAPNALSLSVAIALLCGAPVATAQSTATAEGNEVEVIVVSARKKEERIVDVPIAITAFDAEQIESLGLQSILDLPAVTPGFVYEKFAGLPGRFDNSPRFRGISVNSLAPSRQTASIFVDGIFVSNGVQGIGLEDVERVEIIKGPQSAYFGRLTFGGAVNYVTSTPGDEFRAKISTTAADRSDFRVQGSVEGPIIQDKLSARLSASYHDHAGHFRAASTGDELGQERTSALGATFYFTPTENLDVRIRGYYFENDDGAPSYAFSGLNDHNCGPFGTGSDTTVCGAVPINAPDLNVPVSAGLANAISNLPALNGGNLLETGLARESTRLSAQFNYDVPNSNLTVSGLFGVNDEEVNILRDADDTGDLAFQSFAGRTFEDSSAELRLSGLARNDRLRWSIGVNSFNQEFTSNGDFIVPALGFLDFGGSNPGIEDISTLGIFGSLSYDLSDEVTLTLEGRRQTDEVLDDADITDNEAGTTTEFTNFLPRAILEWQVMDEALLYFSYSEGNLPGGFNGEVDALTPEQLAQLRGIESGAGPTFAEEKLENFEAGWKQTFHGGDGVATFALFHMDRSNQTFRRADLVDDPNQPQGFQQIDYFINAGKSTVNGFELETSYQFNSIFALSGQVAYIDSQYEVFNSGVHNELFGVESAAGKTAERFPEWAGSLSGIFNGSINTSMDWFARADWFYQGKRFGDEGNLVFADAGSQINVRAGIQTDRYRAELFVRNLTDDDTPTAINRFRDLSFATPLFDFSTFGYQVGLRDRRQVGLRFSLTL